jgi:hypothetical protein
VRVDDVQLLQDLLWLLPSFRMDEEDEEFWEAYAKSLGRGWDWPYVTRKLDTHFQPESEDEIGRLATYCLMFFDVGENEAALALLDPAVAPSFDTPRRFALAERWVRSVCETAWRLHVSVQAKEFRRAYMNRRAEGL